MIDGLIAIQTQTMDEFFPYPPYPMYPSGLIDESKSIYRYAHPSSDCPVLIIKDPIYDEDRNYIPPGHYSLVLSDDRTFLLLVQGDKIFATIPVFKLEESKEEVEKIYDKKYQKQQSKEKKKQDKINAKLARTGTPPQEKSVYMEASIEYDNIERYYLIKYERGFVRAWGAIKR